MAEEAKAQTWNVLNEVHVPVGGDRVDFARLKFHVTESYDDFTLSIDMVQVLDADPRHVVSVCESVTMRKYVPGEMRPRPLRISKREAQDLVDQLCARGIRPTSAPDIPIGEKQAMAEHIATLKKANERIDLLHERHEEDLRSERDWLRAEYEDVVQMAAQVSGMKMSQATMDEMEANLSDRAQKMEDNLNARRSTGPAADEGAGAEADRRGHGRGPAGEGSERSPR